MNKLLAYQVLLDNRPLGRILPQFIRGYEINIDCYWVDQRRYRREMRKYRRRLLAIGIATSYNIAKEYPIEAIDNLYSNRPFKMPDLDEASLDEMCKLMIQNWDNYKITPTRLVVPPWAAKEIVDKYGEFTTENYFKWHKARYGI